MQNDKTKESQLPTPAPPEKPVPGPNDKVMKIWRDEKGQVWVDDGDMGAANAFNLVHWAQMICWSPFFGRQIQAEIVQSGFIMGRMLHEHELRMHGATGPGSDLVSPGGEKLTSASTPSVLGGGGRDEVRHSRQSGESKEETGPTHEVKPTGDTLQSPPKR